MPSYCFIYVLNVVITGAFGVIRTMLLELKAHVLMLDM